MCRAALRAPASHGAEEGEHAHGLYPRQGGEGGGTGAGGGARGVHVIHQQEVRRQGRCVGTRVGGEGVVGLAGVPPTPGGIQAGLAQHARIPVLQRLQQGEPAAQTGEGAGELIGLVIPALHKARVGDGDGYQGPVLPLPQLRGGVPQLCQQRGQRDGQMQVVVVFQIMDEGHALLRLCHGGAGKGKGAGGPGAGGAVVGVRLLSRDGGAAIQAERARHAGQRGQAALTQAHGTGSPAQAADTGEEPVQHGRVPRSAAVAGDEFLGDVLVGQGGVAVGVMLHHGLAEAGGLTDAHGAGDDGVVYLIRQVFPHLLDDLVGQLGVAVHGHDDAFMHEVRVGAQGAYLLHDVENLGEAVQREEFALHGGQHFITGAEGGGHEHAEGGRGVQKDVVVKITAAQALRGIPHAGEVGAVARELHLHAGEVHVRGDDGEVAAVRGAHLVLQQRLPDEGGVQAVITADFYAERGAGICLGIHVDEQHAFSAGG